MGETLLSCRGLTRRPWFENWDIDLQAGELIVLRGRSGSGKSLLLRALADIDPADVDSLTLEGRERAEIAPEEWRRSVLYVHQTAPRIPGTVAENLARIRALVPKVPAAARPFSDALGLDPAADADRLSGGEAQLLALARAFSISPRVYLLDEPTSALDEEASRRAESLIVRRASEGSGVLWVTHENGLAERLGARGVSFP